MKKGVSLIALLTTIVVMTILLSAVTVSGIKALNDSKKMQFASEISYIQELVDSYKLKNGTYPIADEYSLNINDIEYDFVYQFSGEDVNNNSIILYKIDTSLIGSNELKYGNLAIPEDIYLLSQKTGRVYYANGVLIDNVEYYTLTDELKKAINYKDNDEIKSNNEIIFEYENVNWTNVPLDLNVKVPLSYSDVKLNIIQGQDSTELTTNNVQNNYYIYEIKNRHSNYMIYVSYKINATDERVQTKTFNVNNFDNVAPTFNVSEIKEILNSETGQLYKYVNISDIKDDLSGIKSVKYENQKIDIQNINEYFSNKGIVVKDDSIPIKDGVDNITICVMDNANNYRYIYIEI